MWTTLSGIVFIERLEKMKKEKKIKKALEKMGIIITYIQITRGGHVKFFLENNRFVIASRTPSCNNQLKNIVRDCKKELTYAN